MEFVFSRLNAIGCKCLNNCFVLVLRQLCVTHVGLKFTQFFCLTSPNARITDMNQNNLLQNTVMTIFLNFLFFFKLYVNWCEGIRSPGTGVTDSCKLPCGCWELNPGSLEEQAVSLTFKTSPQPLL